MVATIVELNYPLGTLHHTDSYSFTLLLFHSQPKDITFFSYVICKSTHLENYIPTVMSPLKYTSLPSTVATFLATCLMVVLQPSRYSVFHDGDTPIQLGLP